MDLRPINYNNLVGNISSGAVNGATLPNKSKSLANIYYPEKKLDCKEGLLIGFNMDGHLFVITTVIPRDHLEKLDSDIKSAGLGAPTSDANITNSLEKVEQILKEEKF